MTLRDLTRETAMIAVQGPAAIDLIAPLVDVDLRGMKYYTGAIAQFGAIEVVISRTGYTGEDGCELMVPGPAALDIWQRILDQGQARGARRSAWRPATRCGWRRACRCTATSSPNRFIRCRPAWVSRSRLDQRDFIGRDALVAARSDTACRRRVGLRLQDRRVPREHYPVCWDGRAVGEVTSGTFSPTLDRPIAMAYVEPAAATSGQMLQVDIRGRLAPAEVVDLPFYSRTS